MTVAGWAVVGGVYRLLARSVQVGFRDSRRAIFLARFHFLISFSRAMAARAVEWGSNQTSLVTLYFLVKPGRSLDLCWETRRARLLVTPR